MTQAKGGLTTTLGEQAEANARSARKKGAKAEPTAAELVAGLEEVLDPAFVDRVSEQFRAQQAIAEQRDVEIREVLAAYQRTQEEYEYKLRNPAWRESPQGRQIVERLEQAKRFVLAGWHLDPSHPASALLWDTLSGVTFGQYEEVSWEAAKNGVPHPTRADETLVLLDFITDREAEHWRKSQVRDLLFRVGWRWSFPKRYNEEPFVRRFAHALAAFRHRAFDNRDRMRDRQRALLSEANFGVGRAGAARQMEGIVRYQKAVEKDFEYRCYVRFRYPRPGRLPGQQPPWWDGVVVLDIRPAITAKGGVQQNVLGFKDVVGDIAALLPEPGKAFLVPVAASDKKDGWKDAVHRERPLKSVRDALVRAIRYGFNDFDRAFTEYTEAKTAFDALDPETRGSTKEPSKPTLDQFLGVGAIDFYVPQRKRKGKNRRSDSVNQVNVPSTASEPAASEKHSDNGVASAHVEAESAPTPATPTATN